MEIVASIMGGDGASSFVEEEITFFTEVEIVASVVLRGDIALSVAEVEIAASSDFM